MNCNGFHGNSLRCIYMHFVKLCRLHFVPEEDGSRFRHPEHLEINTMWNHVLSDLPSEKPNPQDINGWYRPNPFLNLNPIDTHNIKRWLEALILKQTTLSIYQNFQNNDGILWYLKIKHHYYWWQKLAWYNLR